MLGWSWVLVTPAALQATPWPGLYAHPASLRHKQSASRARALSASGVADVDAALLEEVRVLPAASMPAHLAVIMDGNARWARRHQKATFEGHAAGVGALRTLISNCIELEPLRSLTVFAFSTENWGRPQAEVDTLLELIRTTLEREADTLHARGVHIRFIGEVARLPRALQALIAKLAARSPPELEHLELVIAVRPSTSATSPNAGAACAVLH
jgi:undecaprenyl diphosphate synthase